MRFGLTERDTEVIIETLATFEEIEEAVIFGSRAMGHAKRGSDVDLALKGKRLDLTTVTHVKFVLDEELPLPYFFDVVHYDSLTNPALKGHIDHEGRTLYEGVAMGLEG